jgi:hypothetical protein
MRRSAPKLEPGPEADVARALGLDVDVRRRAAGAVHGEEEALRAAFGVSALLLDLRLVTA